MYKILSLALVLVGVFSLVNAEQKSADSALEINGAWARATTKSQKTSAAYFQLINNGNVDRTLVSAQSPVADIVQLHTHITQPSGIMVMQEVPSIAVPANSVVEFKSGGYHVMLIGLKKPLVIGVEIPITLQFKNGDIRTVRAKVKPMNMHKMKKHMNMDM